MPDWDWLATFATVLYLAAQLALLPSAPDPSDPVFAGVAGAVVVAAWALADRLDRGGYERLGADPDGSGSLFWLVALYLPWALLPTLGAVDRLLDLPFAVVSPLATYALTPVAAWLSLYGGSDRFGLDAHRFDRLIGGWIAAVAVGYAAAAALELTLSESAVVAGLLRAQAVGVAVAASAAPSGESHRSPNA